jgi:hypothetical protein
MIKRIRELETQVLSMQLREHKTEQLYTTLKHIASVVFEPVQQPGQSASTPLDKQIELWFDVLAKYDSYVGREDMLLGAIIAGIYRLRRLAQK